MDPFGNLSDENQEQIRKFLRFLKQKHDGIVRSVANEINDIKNDRLQDEMFSREDMKDFSDVISSTMKSMVSSELKTIINMSALAVSQVLEKSQNQGIEVDLETSSIENQVLLDAVEKLSLDSMPKSTRRVNNLKSFRDETKAMKDEQDRLQDSNKNLATEVQELRSRLYAAEMKLRSVNADAKGAREENERLHGLEQALSDAKEESNRKLSESTQFQQMRKMMQSQASKIRDLKRRLERYEPDAAMEEDDE